MKVLKVVELVKTFKNNAIENNVLKNISFEIEQGEFTAIMGQSGSGKSTLLYNISGMDRMTSGHVFIDGVDLSGKSDNELADLRLHTMGFVFQNNHLLKNLNILDNICLPGFKANAHPRMDVVEKAEQWMDKLGILEVKAHDMNKVSGGQLQRAAICRALINSPKIIFADEPTGALNSKASDEVLGIFNQLNKEGTSILIVTHDPKVASLAERIIYMVDGVIGAELRLGKCTDETAKVQREEKVFNWLMERGF